MNEHVFFEYKDIFEIRPYLFVRCKYCGVIHTQHELNLSKANQFKIKNNCLSDEEKIIKDIIE